MVQSGSSLCFLRNSSCLLRRSLSNFANLLSKSFSHSINSLVCCGVSFLSLHLHFASSSLLLLLRAFSYSLLTLARLSASFLSLCSWINLILVLYVDIGSARLCRGPLIISP